MANYIVSWSMEVEAESPEDAAAFVDDQYLVRCKYGDWTYAVTDQDAATDTVLISVHND